MKMRALVSVVAALLVGISLSPAIELPLGTVTVFAQAPQTETPIRVFIRAGLKTHAEGEHDYPQFLADWSKLLTARGALVDGGLHFPSAEALAGTDVIVMYKGDAGYMTLEERGRLETFLARGGGLVGLHDAICTDDPDWWATIFGGAKKHGVVNYTYDAPVTYAIARPDHPITQGMSSFTLMDEAFFLMTWASSPEVDVLANAEIAATRSAGTHAGEVVPQIWTYERPFFRGLGGQTPFRAFVWMQGHRYENFEDPNVQPMLLRAIAWAAKRPVDTLATERRRPR